MEIGNLSNMEDNVIRKEMFGLFELNYGDDKELICVSQDMEKLKSYMKEEAKYRFETNKNSDKECEHAIRFYETSVSIFKNGFESNCFFIEKIVRLDRD